MEGIPLKRIEKVADMAQAARRLASEGKSIGFVPTMGFLHEGHLALAAEARKENDVVIMSIFVNPAQFGPGEDFEGYPRDLERDAELAEKAGVDLLFHPSSEEMYPEDSDIRILPGRQAGVLCGASRPGHFDGVLKVLTKLFHLARPERAYFGQKDAQQLAIIETFVRDYNFPLEIRRVPTVREKDGLAKSSRNVRLTAQERRQAPSIYEALREGARVLRETGDAELALGTVGHSLGSIPGAETDYAEILEYPSLFPLSSESREAIIAAAVRFSGARLIDNILIPLKGKPGHVYQRSRRPSCPAR
ncbi:pantoate--beta-alanine ligase [Bhargavaea beijingensis]|uniref:Pantothenate synthetase n=1 Tax=Bhargavaea beijingensis TaxID=426756 RepID=A0ABX9Z9V7_9BACL|nr:pantoate--beta-alanine ligase [Bhargavaea beijingensis]